MDNKWKLLVIAPVGILLLPFSIFLALVTVTTAKFLAPKTHLPDPDICPHCGKNRVIVEYESLHYGKRSAPHCTC